MTTITNINIDRLQTNINNSLPGIQAQQLMMPEGRITSPDHDQNPIKSAVLIALFEENGILKFPLIRRPIYNGSHSGQMAFPGGKFEKTDRNLKCTALRESHEEIGILPNEVEILGHLSELYIPVTNMLVLPVIGFLKKKPFFVLDKHEVDELFIIELNNFLNPSQKKSEIWNLRGNNVKVPFYHLQEQKIWGATAMMLSEFEQVLKQIQQ